MSLIIIGDKSYNCDSVTINHIEMILKLSDRKYYGVTNTKWHNGQPRETDKYDKIKHNIDSHG